MIVRGITLADIEPLIDISRDMHAESPFYKDIPFEAAVLRGWFFQALETPETVFCRIVEKDGKAVGAMLGHIEGLVFSSVKFAWDVGIYVYPEYRGSRAAYLLVKEFDSWAIAQGCVRAVMCVTTGINNDKALNFYRKSGFEDAGQLVHKRYS